MFRLTLNCLVLSLRGSFRPIFLPIPVFTLFFSILFYLSVSLKFSLPFFSSLFSLPIFLVSYFSLRPRLYPCVHLRPSLSLLPNSSHHTFFPCDTLTFFMSLFLSPPPFVSPSFPYVLFFIFSSPFPL